MTNLAAIGAGYVGLTTAVCLAYLGHNVRCTDVNQARIDALRDGRVPIVEDGLGPLLADAAPIQATALG